MKAGGQLNWLRKRRKSMLPFSIDNESIVLTDQHPINEKNIAFQENWTLPDLIEAINQRVFFWRGDESGLLKSNQGHFKKHQKGKYNLVFLRLRFHETNIMNAERGPDVCKYNSGAARQNDGKPIPRGPKTFIQTSYADFPKGKVQEVVFSSFVDLPGTTEICSGSWNGPWRPLFQDIVHNK